ncbi:MAG TPA: NADP-dependent oxidoreductase, partial [Actinophytocola sp.]|uniref:NADP-dependent oxidoreductase n=1 Tax=Actinophytocola sp. TaxID=1872138 RepID=UPI002DB7412B
DTVAHALGWREHAVVDAGSVGLGGVGTLRRVDTSIAPAETYLGVLGGPGLTAYVGLLEVAALREGDIVWISAAAGAVGGLAAQIAKLRGHYVVGSAGSDEKVRMLLDDYGLDAAFNYRAGPVAEQLRAAAPDGIDVYFDNVGGEHLEAAIDALQVHGRVTVCGMISQYNATEPTPAPRNLGMIIAKRLAIRGMLVMDHTDLRPAFYREMSDWIRRGEVRYQETEFSGLRNAPDAFLAMLDGHNIGKMLVRLDL